MYYLVIMSSIYVCSFSLVSHAVPCSLARLLMSHKMEALKRFIHLLHAE